MGATNHFLLVHEGGLLHRRELMPSIVRQVKNTWLERIQDLGENLLTVVLLSRYVDKMPSQY